MGTQGAVGHAGPEPLRGEGPSWPVPASGSCCVPWLEATSFQPLLLSSLAFLLSVKSRSVRWQHLPIRILSHICKVFNSYPGSKDLDLIPLGAAIQPTPGDLKWIFEGRFKLCNSVIITYHLSSKPGHLRIWKGLLE